MLVVAALVLGGAALTRCQPAPDARPVPPESGSASAAASSRSLDLVIAQRVALNPPLGALPPDPTNRFADNDIAAELGHRIFFDARFSRSGTVSCSTCHDPAHGFADDTAIAVGEGRGTRHSMSVLNVAYNRWFTWDGRADTLWSQALQPFETAHEHDFPRAKVAALVARDHALHDLYDRAFGTPPSASDDATFANIGKALAAYERKLITKPSAYDRWWNKHAAHDPTADAELDPAARRGLTLFFGKANCWQCHHGPNFTDGEFHSLGLPTSSADLERDSGRYSVVDGVRANPFNAAGCHSDSPDCGQARISASLVRTPDLWGRMKTPSLRTAARTGPYMHQGQFKTLADVVHFYSTLEGAVALDHHKELVLTKLNLSDGEQADLVAFLRSLDGEPPGAPWGVAPAGAVPAQIAAPPTTASLTNFTQEVPGTAISFDMVAIPGDATVKPFHISATEVPWDLYDQFVYQLDAKEGNSTPEADAVARPTKPYISMDRGFGHAGWPAISMSAHNARKFCEWLSVKTGRTYRLPTIAEWRLAAQLHTAPADKSADFAWTSENSDGTTHKIGSKPAPGGVHDLCGNAAEWVTDDAGAAFIIGGCYRDEAGSVGPARLLPDTPDWNASDPQFPKSLWWLADGGFIGVRLVCPQTR